MATITFDTDNLSTLDKYFLAILLDGETKADPPATPVVVSQPSSSAGSTLTVVSPPYITTTNEVVPDVVPALSVQDAVDAATELVASGQAAKVKAALANVGAKRVSEIAAGDIAAFIAELKG